MQRIKILDSCRGLAALTVVFHHVYTRFSNLFINTFPEWLQNIFQTISDLNVQAVLFFFFLSGFSICLSVRQELPLHNRSFNNYAYRRLKRILPLYFTAIAVTFLSGWFSNSIFLNDDFSIKNLFGNFLFLQSSKSYKGNWFAPYGDNGPLWSLSFEMFYYFFLPVFLLGVLKIFPSKVLTPVTTRIALIFSFGISIGCVLLNKMFFFPYIAFTGLFYVWFAGYFVAEAYLKQKITFDKNFFLLLLILGVLFLMNYVVPSATLDKLLFGAAIAVAFFIFYRVREKMQFILLRNLESKFNFLFHAVGTGSYAIYLLHYPLLMTLREYIHLTLWQLFAFVVILMVSCICLERYFVRKKWLFLKQQYIT